MVQRGTASKQLCKWLLAPVRPRSAFELTPFQSDSMTSHDVDSFPNFHDAGSTNHLCHRSEGTVRYRFSAVLARRLSTVWRIRANTPGRPATTKAPLMQSILRY
jgi:hypothetical protein